MFRLFILTLLVSLNAAAASYICDVKNSPADVVMIEVTPERTESVVRHQVDSAAGTHVETILFQRNPAMRAGEIVDSCKADDHNQYLPVSKAYYIGSLCAAKSSGQPISVVAEFSEKTGGKFEVRTLNGYYAVSFTNCAELP